MVKKTISYQTEEHKELMKFILVLVIVLGLIGCVFFLSKFFLKSDVADLTYKDGSVSTNVAIVGTLLNQSENDYYVLAYDFHGYYADAYSSLANYYSNAGANSVKIYYLDLSSAFNKSYFVSENSNKSATKIKDLKMVDGTLIRVKNKKIVEYTETFDKIAEKLKVS